MNRRKPAYLVIIFLVAFNYQPQEICAQASLPQVLAKPLTIGDTVPDVVLENIINYPSSSARLSDFKGKLLILDFFAKWCTSCIKALPHMDSLQKQFGYSLQILVVTADHKVDIDLLLKRSKLLASVNLAFVTSNSVLREYFPHKFLPHQVWIKNGCVVAITEPQYVNHENIALTLQGGGLSLPLKKDNLEYDNKTPLLFNGNGGSEEKLHIRSTIVAYLPGLGNGEGLLPYNDKKRLYFNNISLTGLYQSIYRFPLNRIALEVSNTEPFTWPAEDNDSWYSNYLFSCELIAPQSWAKEKMQHWLLNDVNKYFGYSLSKELRMVDCLALVADTTKLQRSQYTRPQTKNLDDYTYSFRGYSTKQLVDMYNSDAKMFFPAPIIVDETGYSGCVDFEVKVADMGNLKSFEKTVQKMGFYLVPVKRPLEILVVTETN